MSEVQGQSAGRKPWMIDIDGIRKFLPHWYPILLVDRILDITTPVAPKGLTASDDKIGIRVTGIKALSFGESVFQGHFPEQSIFPGVQIIESMAQVACFAVYPFLQPGMPDHGGKFSCMLAGVDGARFRRPVTPGDILRIEAEVTKFRASVWGFRCVATVDGQKVAEADILANLVHQPGGAQ